MFVLLLTYTKPLDEVDALMRKHMAWLNEQYAAGRFVVSGRQIPRTGGVILARGDDREEIEALAASDPFVAGGVATCEVIQFRPSQTAAGLRLDVARGTPAPPSTSRVSPVGGLVSSPGVCSILARRKRRREQRDGHGGACGGARGPEGEATCWVFKRSTRRRSRSSAARARTWGSFRESKASACRPASA